MAMPALAALLMLIGYRTIKPQEIKAVWRTGATQATVMTVTFVLTMIIPLQNAVMFGIGISVILFVIKQSNRMTLKRWVFDDDGRAKEVEPPETVGANEVIVLQPYGSLFFASAPVFEEALPDVVDESSDSVVIVRLRGKSDLGSTFMEVITRYAYALRAKDCKLVLLYADEKVKDQLEVTGTMVALGAENVYESDEWLGATVRRAHVDAMRWVDGDRED